MITAKQVLAYVEAHPILSKKITVEGSVDARAYQRVLSQPERKWAGANSEAQAFGAVRSEIEIEDASDPIPGTNQRVMRKQ